MRYKYKSQNIEVRSHTLRNSALLDQGILHKLFSLQKFCVLHMGMPKIRLTDPFGTTKTNISGLYGSAALPVRFPQKKKTNKQTLIIWVYSVTNHEIRLDFLSLLMKDKKYDFMFALLYTRLLLKRSLLWKEIICSQVSFWVDPFSKGNKKTIWQSAPPPPPPLESVSTRLNVNIVYPIIDIAFKLYRIWAA